MHLSAHMSAHLHSLYMDVYTLGLATGTASPPQLRMHACNKRKNKYTHAGMKGGKAMLVNVTSLGLEDFEATSCA